MSPAELQILASELKKAASRLANQRDAVEATKAIINSPVALPSLKKIATLRLPKMLATLKESIAVVSELEAALQVPAQADIESAAPPKPLKGSR